MRAVKGAAVRGDHAQSAHQRREPPRLPRGVPPRLGLDRPLRSEGDGAMHSVHAMGHGGKWDVTSLEAVESGRPKRFEWKRSNQAIGQSGNWANR